MTKAPHKLNAEYDSFFRSRGWRLFHKTMAWGKMNTDEHSYALQASVTKVKKKSSSLSTLAFFQLVLQGTQYSYTSNFYCTPLSCVWDF